MVHRTGKPPSVLLDELYGLVGQHCYDRLDLELDAADHSRMADTLNHLVPSAVDGVPVERIDRLDGVMLVLKDHSWVLYRLSGTEPLVRIYVETDSPGRVPRLLAAGRALLGL
jgi:phosphomannomutase